MSEWENNEEIKIFREYLRIPSVQPNVEYDDVILFLQEQARSLNLLVRIYYPASPKRPVLVLTWVGLQPELPSILLNSHMDVVPVFEEYWTHPPFAAEMDKEGRIFARGSQDMKCVSIWYLAAIRALKRDGVQLKRTVHVVFVPDEEIGGELGMGAFVQTNDFKALNVAFVLDEGLASPTDVFPVYYAERSPWQTHFKFRGTTGHGSLLLQNTIGEKIQYIINRMYEFRANEVAKLANNSELSLGDVTTVNLTVLNGGVLGNVVPAEATLVFDIRIANDVDHKTFDEQLRRWCVEGGGDIKVEYEKREAYVKPTAIDHTNPFWAAFRDAMVDDLNLKIQPRVFPGGTDSRYIRAVNIPAIGFTPINNTPVLLHDNDEYIRADTFLAGIEIYKKLIPKLANV